MVTSVAKDASALFMLNAQGHGAKTGESFWARVERYGPLQLDERPVYNCIKLVGDFMGFIEQLLQALKVELKQFSEFENWMEQGKSDRRSVSLFFTGQAVILSEICFFLL